MSGIVSLKGDVFLQDASLDNEGLKSGDLLLIEAGRLPPKV